MYGRGIFVLLIICKVRSLSLLFHLRGHSVMKKFIPTLITIQLLYIGETLVAQPWTWSSLRRITETTAQDHHPVFANVGSRLGTLPSTTILAFDRTDSVGTNICIVTFDRNGWSPDVRYITSGRGINDYPSIASGERKAMVVYQSEQGFAHNIFYSMRDSSGWSPPLAITEDTDQDNLYPNVASLGGDKFAVVWERNGRIYLREHDCVSWLDAFQLTPHDSLHCAKPAVFGSGSGARIIVVWERSKYSAPTEHDLFYAVRKDSLWRVDSLTTVGDNRNPRFVNGGGGEIIWQRNAGARWEIYGARNLDNPYSKPELGVVSADSEFHYTQCSGAFLLLPTAGIHKGTASHTFLKPFIVGAWQRSSPGSQDTDIVLSNYVGGDQAILVEGTQRNPSVGVLSDGNGCRVWAIWESSHTGTWNLFGMEEYIPITSVNDKRSEMRFSLHQNFPNPFNPSTVIKYEIQIEGVVILSIHDLLGNDVQRFSFGRQYPGVYSVVWDGKDKLGRNAASGVYVYRLTVAIDQLKSYAETRKMLLIR